MLNLNNYCVVNIWTSGDNQQLCGDSVGHVSLETNLAYYSLWPQPRTDQEMAEYRALSPAKQKQAALKANYIETRPPRFLANYNTDVQFEGRNADARIVLYSLDSGLINAEFTSVLKPGITSAGSGWRMVGSNIISRTIGNSAESCASLAYRLLVAGGLGQLVGRLAMSSISSQNSSAVRPDVILEQILAAKEKELIAHPETVPLVYAGETNLNTLRQCIHPGQNTAASNSKTGLDAEPSCLLL